MSQALTEIQQTIEEALQHHRAGRLAEAEVVYREVLSCDPDNFDALHLLGVLYRQAGDVDRAIALISQAVMVQDAVPEAFNNLGVAMQAANRFGEAVEAYRRAITLRPDYAAAHFNLGNVFAELERYQDAVTSFREAIELNPDCVESYVNLASALRDIGALEQAELFYRKAVTIRPSADIYGSLGAILSLLGKPDEAEKAYRDALDIDPDFVEASYNLSLVELMLGKYEAGFPRYESRFATPTGMNYVKKVLSPAAAGERWNGEPLAGRSLLVVTEQGLGDNLMMMRYLLLLKQQGARRVQVCTHHLSLKRVFDTIAGVDAVVTLDEVSRLLDVDYYCPSMSLPHLCRTTFETIPQAIPYVAVPPEMKQLWRDRFAGLNGLKVGLVWSGWSLNYNDAVRSIPLSMFAPLLENKTVKFFSVQKGEAAQQIGQLGWEIIDWMDECSDFLDTATLVDQLDLVIGVDTAAVHLAGALGKPVWLLNRFAGDWRWLQHRTDSPWYPSMKIFRQPTRGDWDSVIHAVAEELNR